MEFSHQRRPWKRPWLLLHMLYFLVDLLSFPIPSKTGSISEATINNTQFQGTSQAALYTLSDQQVNNILRLLSFLNKPAVNSIQSPDGDIIDCVPIRQQPAFDHPSLKDHKIKQFPTARPQTRSSVSALAYDPIKQVWNDEGIECPVGTVPIRRTSIDDIRRTRTVGSFGRKSRAELPRPIRRDFSGGYHEHAIAFVSGERYAGAKATINVWQPRIQEPEEFSISQMWIISGSFNHDLNTIEAGWQVSPELYGDNRPRFFIYWTSDGYQETGCYNLLCSGFIQTSNKIAVGGAIAPVSSYGGSQFDIRILIWKDPIHGDWWMEFGDSMLVGYWPASLFTHLRNEASLIEWGGEVVDRGDGGHHTSTGMGSGHFSEEGFGRASYFRNLECVDGQNNLRPVSGLRTTADRPNCYDIKPYFNSNWGHFFYYGGPGRNPRCP